MVSGIISGNKIQFFWQLLVHFSTILWPFFDIYSVSIQAPVTDKYLLGIW